MPENPNRIGMPAALALDRFGYVIQRIFGEIPYHVGSSANTPNNRELESVRGFRDVDVRLILDDERYRQDYGDPEYPFANEAWCEVVEAMSLLGRTMTGLPIDFQIQSRSKANREYPGNRSALGIDTSMRRQKTCPHCQAVRT